VLAVIAGLIGLAFAKIVYLVEDLWDRLWRGRPEWARPAVGGIVLGLFLLAVPQMYGVGYPVMYKTVAGGYALWFLILLAAAKIAATSLSLGIGGSGGIFAPSLFIGVTSGYAFGDIADHAFGPAAGQPALYAVVAMGAVFASAARAPLTSLASVVEMTGNFAITLPVMLAIAIAATVSRALSYGTIYTTKLLRRGTDIDRAAPWRALQDLKVTDTMRAFRPPLPVPPAASGNGAEAAADGAAPGWAELAGPVTERHDPQVLFGAESVTQALRQLEAYGHDGLPVLSADGEQVQGWVTGGSVLRAIARQLGAARAEAEPGQDEAAAHPPAPLAGYQVVELEVTAGSAADGARLDHIAWPEGGVPVSVLRNRLYRDASPGLTMRPGDRISLLVPAAGPSGPGPDGRGAAGQPEQPGPAQKRTGADSRPVR
jgi:CIC family chloride channel protein